MIRTTVAAGAFLGLGALASAQSQALYIADPYTACVYRSDLASPGQPPELVSGEAATLADRAVFLSDDEVVLSVRDRLAGTHNLYLADLAAGTWEPLDVFTPPKRIVDLTAGTDGDTFAFVSENPASPIDTDLAVATRNPGTGEWTVTHHGALAGDVLANYLQVPRDVELIAADLVALSDNGNPAGNVVQLHDLGTSPSTVTTTISTTPQLLLAASGDGRFLAWPRTASPLSLAEPIRFFDSQGQPLGVIEPSSAAVLAEKISAGGWQDSVPGFALVGRTGLWTGTDPADGTPVLSEAFSFLTGGVPDPTRDVSGSTTVRQLADGTFRLHHPNLAGILRVDPANGRVTTEVLTRRGTGPSLALPIGIVVAPSGTIFVTDHQNDGIRIVRIDPVTGDRTVIALVPPPFTEPWLARTTDGAFLLASLREIPLPETTELQSGLNIVRVVPTADPLAPQIDILASGSVGAQPVDFLAAPDGSPLFLLSPGSSMIVGGVDAGAFVPRPALTLTGGEMAYGLQPDAPNPQRPVHHANLDYPVSSLPANPARMVIGFSYPRTGVGRYESLRDAKIVSPSGVVFRSADMTAAQSSYMVEGVTHLRITWTLPRSAYGDSAGEWRILLEFGQQIPGIVPFLTANPAPGARQFAASADGTLRVLQISPSRISTWDMANGGTTDLPVADPLEPGLPAGLLGRPFDFAVAPQGDRAFVSILDEPLVLEVDLATGASTVQTPSRPAVIDEEFLGLQGVGLFHVAVGPVPPPSGAASTWMLLGD